MSAGSRQRHARPAPPRTTIFMRRCVVTGKRGYESKADAVTVSGRPASKSAGGVSAPRRMEQGDESMPVVNLHPDLGDIAERVDNGRRLALVETAPQSLDTVERMRIEEFGTPRAEIALERLEDARVLLLDALRIVDTEADRDLHVAIGQHLQRHDDLMAVIQERLS